MARASAARRRVEKRREREERLRRETRRRQVRTGGIAAGVLLVVATALFLLWPSPETGNTTAEAWDLPALDGHGRVALAEFRGTPVVAAFFASWCEVCEAEIPQFLDVSREVSGEVTFVGIDMQDNGRGLPDARKWGLVGVWPLARDIGNGNGSALSTGTFGMRGSPMTVFYDAEGRVLRVVRGGITGAQLRAALRGFYGVDT